MKKIFSCLVALAATCQLSMAQTGVKKNADVAKDTIHVIGHAHMDMNWLWTLSETVKMANDNLRQAVTLMKDYPDYTMLQSQAAVYHFVEQQDPLLFNEVKKCVASGRLEPVGGMWVESDQNMASGEGLSRSLLLGQRYFQSRFGRMARVGWLPDDFGHTSQLPQMLKQAGMNYFFFMRTSPFPGSFWWVGADGSRVLAYNSGSYNGSINENLKNKLTKYPGGRNRVLSPTGEGDHGGGPSRAAIDKVHELNARADFPSVKFTTAENFFKQTEKEMDGRPTHYGEMGFIFEGCYTNVAEIKEFNRNCENTLYQDEFFNSLNWLRGAAYPAQQIHDMWEGVAFNEFHDILPGSAIYESNRESVARFNEIYSKAGFDRDKAFRTYVDRINFKKGWGQPIVAFNLQPSQRKALVEAEVFSYKAPATANVSIWPDYYGYKNVSPKTAGTTTSVMVRDDKGNTYPAQVVAGKLFPPGYRSKVAFVVDNMPAGGYKTFYVDTEKPGVLNDEIPFSDNTFETDYFKVKIDARSGDIVSLVDKATGKEYVKAGGKLNTLRMYNEMKKGEMKSWLINSSTTREDATAVNGGVKISNGPVRACVEVEKTWGKSRFKVRTYIYRSLPRIDYDVNVRWLETGSDSTESPMLRAVFPIDMTGSRFYCQVPFNVVERPADGMLGGKPTPEELKNREDPRTVERADGQEVPAQKWVDVSDGQYGFALLNRSKYGHCFDKGELRLTLMRSAGHPDIYPNLGNFNIEYSIMPHQGDWTNGVLAAGEDFNVPVYAAEPLSTSLEKKGADMPAEQSLIAVDKANVMLSAVKKAEDGNELIVRLCEMTGKETPVHLTLPKAVSGVRRLTLLEYPFEGASKAVCKGQGIDVTLKSHEIVTLGVKIK